MDAMNAFSAAGEQNLICEMQTFGKKENVSQDERPGGGNGFFRAPSEEKLPSGYFYPASPPQLANRWRLTGRNDQTTMRLFDDVIPENATQREPGLNPPTTVRKAQPTDLPMVYQGELDYIRSIEPAHEQRWKDAMHAHLRQWTGALARMSVLEQDGAAVGYCFWEVIEGAAVLASIHVQNEWRQRGLGRVLLAHYVDEARARGFTQLRLSVFRGNPAQFLYESAGFRCVRRGEDYLDYEWPAAAPESST
jgi:ribosomal protein S18 acetylase RimI-like enzyme